MREWRTLQFRAMNTAVETSIEAPSGGIDREGDPAAFVQSWFVSVERRYSRFLPDSELSALNRSAGKPFLVSPTLLELLQLAEKHRAWTNGLFSPYLLKALVEAGYDRSFDELQGVAEHESDCRETLHTVPGNEPNERTGDRVSSAQDRQPEADAAPTPPKEPLSIDAGMGVVVLAEGEAVDLGGIAKSWAVERAAGWLQGRWEAQRGLINAGGDVRVWGGVSPVQPWIVAIVDPWRPEADIAELAVTDGAVATSSVLGRRWRHGDSIAHHLIDPRTRRPAESDIVQCSVAGDDLTACEVAAKTICILGREQGASWLKQAMPEARALLCTENHGIHQIGTGWEVLSG